MKKSFLIVYLLLINIVFGQQKIFQKSISEKDMLPYQKITTELASNYLNTHYYYQPGFNLKANLEISLPSNRIIKTIYSNQYTYTNKTTSFVYKIEGEPYSELVFSKFENTLMGIYVSQNGEKLMFHQTQPNIFAVSEVNQTKLDQQEKEDDFILPSVSLNNKGILNHADVCLPENTPCPSTIIDVMVLYTTAAKNIWGGLAQSNANVATAITNFNISLLNSGVSNTNVNLVYSGEINYSESGNINTDLSRLYLNNDGYMDDVHTLRTTYGADLVALVTSTPTTTCGVGYLNLNSTNYSNATAFSVSLYNCAVSNITLAHEMGHNMGLNHDWYVASANNPPCSHQKGYINKVAITMGSSSPIEKRWRTIMAYSSECVSVGIDCPKINRWSNPDLIYNGDPTGRPMTDPKPTHAALILSRAACIVADFMPTATLATEESSFTSDENFQVYPNPASEQVEIIFKGDSKYTFKVFNVVGQLMLETQQKRFSVVDWSSGTYIMAVYDNGGNIISSKKLLVK